MQVERGVLDGSHLGERGAREEEQLGDTLGGPYQP